MSREGEWLLISSPALERLESRFHFADQVEECTPRDCCRLLSKAVVGHSEGKMGTGEESGIQVLPKHRESRRERWREREREREQHADRHIHRRDRNGDRSSMDDGSCCMIAC